jgi:hypothetical protein
MTSPKTKPVVTRADREASARFLGDYAADSMMAEWVGDGAMARDTEHGVLMVEASEEQRLAELLATTRTEAHAAGRMDERRDVTAWLRSVEGWRPPRLAESIDDECHVGAHEMAGCTAKESP